MALYGVSNLSATTPALGSVATTHKTFLQVAAQTTGIRRAFIYEWKVGPNGVPNTTDCEIAWTLIRQTTAGTGSTAMTVSALDQADSAAATVAIAGTITAEPTGPRPGLSTASEPTSVRAINGWWRLAVPARSLFPPPTLRGMVSGRSPRTMHRMCW